MLDTGSPPQHEEEKDFAVSPPLSSYNAASRSSTPALSSLDGTPRFLYVPQEAPLSPSPPSPPSTLSPNMAIRPVPLLSHGFPPEPDHLTSAEMPPRIDGARGTTGIPDGQHLLNGAHQEASMPDVGAEPVQPLTEISRLLHLQRYNRRRCSQSRENLQNLQVAAAKTARLIHTARSVQRTLSECIKGEDKISFANLLHAFRDACDDCSTPTNTLHAETIPGISIDRGATSFFRELSTSSQAIILDFLTQIRGNADFIADRLTSLSQKELLSLLPERFNARSTESILGGQSRVNSRTAKPLGFVVDTQIELLSTHTYGSALDALVGVTRSINSADRLESQHFTSLWASICARLISERKEGSERIVPAILDTWVSSQPWPGKDRVEVWILQTLQNGSFLLEQSTKQTFRARVEGRSELTAEDETRAEAFYAQSADALLDILGDEHGPSAIPPGVLEMCHAMWHSLKPSVAYQRTLPMFLSTRWLFSTFLQDITTLPEAYGLLTDHYVSDLARQRILREVAIKAQKAAFDVAYAWKHSNPLSAETTQRVHKILTRLQGKSSSPYTSASHSTCHSRRGRAENLVVVSAKDVVQCLTALYPQRRPASIASDGENLKSGLQSSASSISGFSLFSNARPAEPFTESVTSNFHTLRVTGSPVGSEHQEFEDSSFVSYREACIELEELINGHSAGSRDLWEAFHSASIESSLENLANKFAKNVPSDHSRVELSREAPIGRTSSKEFVSSSRAVELLLLDDHLEIPHSHDVLESNCGEYQNFEQQCIESLFEQAVQECQARADFVKAHCWFRQLRDFRYFVRSHSDEGSLRAILRGLEETAVRSIEQTSSQTAAQEKWSNRLKSSSQLRTEYLEPFLKDQLLLRDKMWYVADVRTSAAYEEARSIAAALRVMGKPKRPVRTRIAPPLRHWNMPRVSSTNLHLKSEAQILEILSARPDHGGPNKLSDEQSKLVELWMDRQNIDNLCRGEERLHKLCMEVRKCVDLITATPSVEQPSIQHNMLFARDESIAQERVPQRRLMNQSSSFGVHGAHSYLSLTSQARSNDALSTTSRELSSVSSQEYLESRSPTLTNQSSVPFWSPSTTEVDSPSSATSIRSSRTQSAVHYAARKSPTASAQARERSLEALRQRATSLLLSDLAAILFSNGSETDRAFWSGLGRDLTERYMRGLGALQTSIGTQTPRIDFSIPQPTSAKRFDFESAFGTLLAKFSAVTNPSTKLACLYDVDRLLVPYVAEKNDHFVSVSVARAESDGDRTPARRVKDPAETSISGFRDIFTKSSLRPATIFRDLQYIAALLPASILQDTPQGKAFYHAAVAITALKQEAKTIMVETADSIIAYHSNNRGHGRSSSTAQQQRDSAIFSTPSRTPSAEDVSRYSMADAGYLLQITAREGDIVAQRELATLYLTHPELMDRIVAPFARPRDVFKDELESKWRKNQDPNRCDPTTMCVAHHWMSLSSKGGDSLAKEYLRQREEMDSF